MIINIKSLKGGVIWLSVGIKDADFVEKSLGSVAEDADYAVSVIECSSF